MFTAFDRVWLLVGLALALVVSWMTLSAIWRLNYLDGFVSEQDFAGTCCIAAVLSRAAISRRNRRR